MNRKISTTIIASSFVIFVFYFSLTIEEGKYNNNFFNNIEIFAQDDNAPVVKNSKIIEFSGINYADVVNSRDINLNSFTVSVWFNTAMNVTSGNNGILLNKGGFGSDRPGFNLNYGIWLNNREKVTGGFETQTGDDYSLTSQGSYDDSTWHNAILT
ncbi:MAG TPA: hypothetical protein VFK40_10975, partial [Nitrososphaeraceae archaeon]|nr:hypothetical protein [Nitrososphaeraceae archaeon]